MISQFYWSLLRNLAIFPLQCIGFPVKCNDFPLQFAGFLVTVTGPRCGIW